MATTEVTTTRDRLVQIVEAEPKKYRQAELGRTLGVSRQRVHDFVKKLGLNDLVKPKKHWSFHCLDCGKPIHSGSIRCRQCWSKLYGKRVVTLTCDFCGKQFERKESETRRHKRHFCSNNCRNSYGAIYKWTTPGTKLAKLTLTCDFCGKQFERKESKARRHKRHFCSNNCRNAYATKFGWFPSGYKLARAVKSLPLVPQTNDLVSQTSPKLRTRVFELYKESYPSLVQVAQAMGISNSQIYRVRNDSRPINEKFIVGALKAFPGHKLGDLFYIQRRSNG